MHKKVLVVYYTQSGQLKKIVDNILKPLSEESVQLTYERIQPVDDYPFPWGSKFYDCLPESVNLIPCDLKPFGFSENDDYDLVILACQSWYLSPSIPVNSFLQSAEAANFLKGKKVITVHGVRNMWISSQEIIKRRLKEIGATLVGNIVLGDHHDNYIAGFTIIKWLVSGDKGPSGILPEAGVSEKDILNSEKFGKIICQALINDKFDDLQKKLAAANAVQVRFNLWMMEYNARKIFRKFGSFIRKKGGPQSLERQGRITLFKIYLIFIFFIISPFASIIFISIWMIFYPFISKKMEYFKGIEIR